MGKKAIATENVPILDERTNKWMFNGHEVFSYNQNFMHDPMTGFLMSAPLVSGTEAAGETPVVDPELFKVWERYTFDGGRLETHPDATQYPVMVRNNPEYWPSQKTVEQVMMWCAERYPKLLITTLWNPLVNFRFWSPDTLMEASVAPGLLASDIERNGDAAAAERLAATLKQAGVVV